MRDARNRRAVAWNVGAARRWAAGLPWALACVASAATAGAQATPDNPAAEQGVPGAPDPTAPHMGTATAAAVQEKKRPPAVDLSVLYIGEAWRNAGGGIRRGERYLDNLDVTLTVDAGRALGWRGATLFVYGLYDLKSEFDTTNVGSLSLLSSHGIGPEFGQSGRNGPSIFPYTSLAVRGAYKLSETLTARAAVLDGVPDDPDHPKRTTVRLQRSDGALGVVELAYAGAPATLTIGYWRYTARFDVWSAGEAGRGERGNQGGYAVIERRLTRPAGAPPDDKRGLAAFVQAGMAAARFNRTERYVGAGLVYTGVIASGEDRVGVTLARAAFGGRYRDARAAAGVRVDRAESVVELTYRRSLTRFLTVQPDIQYVVHPSGDRTLRDALAGGLRFELGVRPR